VASAAVGTYQTGKAALEAGQRLMGRFAQGLSGRRIVPPELLFQHPAPKTCREPGRFILPGIALPTQVETLT